MALSWNEIKTRAMAFSKEWESESREDAEAKSFWDASVSYTHLPPILAKRAIDLMFHVEHATQFYKLKVLTSMQ